MKHDLLKNQYSAGKIFALVPAIFTGIILAIMVFFQSQIPQKTVKKVALHMLKNRLSEEIKIEKISGDLIRNIVFENVSFKNDPIEAELGYLYVKYDLLKLISKSNKAQAIEKVIIKNSDLKITHDGQSQNKKKVDFTWLKPLKNHLEIQDSKIHFYDINGLVAPPHNQAFSASIQDVNLKVEPNLREEEAFLSGSFKFKGENSKVEGTWRHSTADIKINQLHFPYFNSYFLPFPGYDLQNGQYSLNLKFKALKKENKTSLGFYIYTDLKDADLTLPFFDKELHNNAGRVSISNMTLSKQWLQNQYGIKKGTKVFNKLKSLGVINQSGLIKTLEKEKLTLLESEIKALLYESRVILGLEGLTANLVGMNVETSGYIDLINQSILLPIQTQIFNAKNLKKLYPQLGGLPFEGASQLSCNVQGPLNNVVLNGKYQISKGKMMTLPIENWKMDYQIFPEKMIIFLREGKTQLDQKICATANINFKTSLIDILSDQEILLHNQDVATAYTQRTHYVGDGKKLLVKSHMYDLNRGEIFGQVLEDLKIETELSPYHIVKFITANLNFNNNKDLIQITGKSIDNNTLSLKVKTSSQNNHISIKGFSELTLNENFLKNPARFLTFSVTTNIQNIKILGSTFEKFSMSANWNEQGLRLQQLQVLNPETAIFLKGKLSDKDELDFEIKDGTQLKLNDLPYLSQKIPLKQAKIKTFGYLKGTRRKPLLHLWIQARDVQYESHRLDKLNTTLLLDNDKIIFEKMNIYVDKSHYLADIEMVPNFIWHPSSKTPESLDLNCSIINSDLKEIYKTFMKINSPDSFQLIKRKNGDFELKMSTLDKGNESLILFHHEKNNIHNEFQKKIDSFVNIKKKMIKSDMSGNLKGQVALRWKKNHFPSLNATLEARNVEIGDFKIKEILSNWITSKDNISFQSALKELNLKQKTLDNITFLGRLNKNKTLLINNVTVKRKEQKFIDFLTLRWNFDSNKEQVENELLLNFKKNEVKLLNFFFEEDFFNQNKGWINLTFKDQSGHLQLSQCDYLLKDFSLNLNQNYQGIIKEARQQKGENIAFDNVQLIIQNKNLQQSEVMMRGYADLGFEKRQYSAFFLTSEMDLKLDDFSLKDIEIQNIKGDFRVENFSLKGKFHSALNQAAKEQQNFRIQNKEEQGPLLKARILCKKSQFRIKSAIKKNQFPELFLDLQLKIDDSLFLQSDFLGEGVVSGLSFDFNVEEFEKPLQLFGTLNHPQLQNRLNILSGELLVFNTSFSVLNQFQQQNYTKLINQDVEQNYLSFFSKVNEIDNRKDFIVLNSLAVIKNPETTSSNIDIETKAYSHVLLRLKGPLNSPEIFLFDIFTSNSLQFPASDLRYEQQLAFSQQDQQNQRGLQALLFPSRTAFNNPENAGNSNLFEEYGKQRLNLLFKRSLQPLESTIAEKIGLETIDFDLNVSDALFDSSSQDFGLALKKRLVKDKFYLIMRSHFDLASQEKAHQVSEAAINYMIFQNLSLNLGTIKKSDLDYYQGKFSLRYSYVF